MRAGIAAAAVKARHIHQGLVRDPLLHLVKDPRFRQHDEAFGWARFGVTEQLAGGADEVGQIQEVLLAFGMGDHLRLRMLQLQLQQGLLAEGFVHGAAPRPQRQFTPALALHPTPQVAVRREQHRPVLRQLPHQINGIAAGADQVALGLHRRRAVDVTHHHVVGMLGPERRELIGWAVIGQGAAGIEIRQHHCLLGAEDLGGLRHEMNTAERDHIGVGAGRLAGQLERVTNEISDVLNFRLLVVVRQHHGVALLLQPLDRLHKGGVSAHRGSGGAGWAQPRHRL